MDIAELFASIPGLKADYKEDWKEDAKDDWKVDWDNVPGDAEGAAPVNTVLPAITGTAQEDETLTVSNGTWTGNPAPTFTRQWKRDDANIVGATGTTYVLVTADVGAVITCTVTATNSAGNASATSAGTAAVIAAA